MLTIGMTTLLFVVHAEEKDIESAPFKPLKVAKYTIYFGVFGRRARAYQE